MLIYTVSVYVNPGHENDFIRATRENHRATRREPGNRRFDLAQSDDNPARFFLYEVYDTPEAVKAHKESRHYRQWKETVAPWMSKPREGRLFLSLLPQEPENW